MTKCYKTKLEKVDMSVRGWNWGNVKFVGEDNYSRPYWLRIMLLLAAGC